MTVLTIGLKSKNFCKINMVLSIGTTVMSSCLWRLLLMERQEEWFSKVQLLIGIDSHFTILLSYDVYFMSLFKNILSTAWNYKFCQLLAFAKLPSCCWTLLSKVTKWNKEETWGWNLRTQTTINPKQRKFKMDVSSYKVSRYPELWILANAAQSTKLISELHSSTEWQTHDSSYEPMYHSRQQTGSLQ